MKQIGLALPYMRAFRYNQEDLEANRRGEISGGQQTGWRVTAGFLLLVGYPLFAFLMLGILGSVFKVRPELWVRDWFGLGPGTSGLDAGFFITLLLATIFLIIVTAWLWLPGLLDFRAGQVHTASGHFTKVKPSVWNPLITAFSLFGRWGSVQGKWRTRGIYRLTVEKVSLRVNRLQYQVVSQSRQPHICYYLPRSKVVLSAEPAPESG